MEATTIIIAVFSVIFGFSGWGCYLVKPSKYRSNKNEEEGVSLYKVLKYSTMVSGTIALVLLVLTKLFK